MVIVSPLRRSVVRHVDASPGSDGNEVGAAKRAPVAENSNPVGNAKQKRQEVSVKMPYNDVITL